MLLIVHRLFSFFLFFVFGLQVRENLLDNPEFIDMMLQRWFAQKGKPGWLKAHRATRCFGIPSGRWFSSPGFCVSNVAERRYLAEEFWKIQRLRLRNPVRTAQFQYPAVIAITMVFKRLNSEVLVPRKRISADAPSDFLGIIWGLGIWDW